MKKIVSLLSLGGAPDDALNKGTGARGVLRRARPSPQPLSNASCSSPISRAATLNSDTAVWRARAEQEDAVLQIGAEWESRSAERMERFSDAEALRRWQQWIDETLAWSDRENDYAIVVDKVGRLLILYHDGKELVTFPVDLGIDPVGRKLQEGDNATPEGRYRIQEVRQRGQTRYHRALLLDYPNGEDRARFQMAKEQGTVATDAGIGSLIEIHGMGGRDTDWTDGCVAVANLHMDALVDLVRVGTPVTIVGRRSQTPLPMLNRPTGNAGS